MQKSLRIASALALIGLGIWGWTILFPGPERLIRSRLEKLARTVSVQPGDGAVARGLKAYELPDFFTPDVVISLTVRGFGGRVFTGRDELMEQVNPAMQNVRGLKVEFLDANITLAPDKLEAVVNLTAKATLTEQSDLIVQEFNIKFRKLKGQWLISRVESVKTLSYRSAASNSATSGRWSEAIPQSGSASTQVPCGTHSFAIPGLTIR
jgi:hypothetical protein